MRISSLRNDNWHAYLLQGAGPSLAELAPGLRRLYSLLLLAHPKLGQLLLLQSVALSGKPEGLTLSRNARRWSPVEGGGVWLDREPLRMPETSDIENLDHTTPSRHGLLYDLYWITADRAAKQEIREIFAGSGALLHILSPVSASRLTSEAARITTHLRNDLLAHQPFVLPLLSSHFLRDATSQQVQEAMCGASVYMRECTEENAVVLLSDQPLASMFQELGAQLNHDGTWTVNGDSFHA